MAELMDGGAVERVRTLWRELTRAPEGFVQPGWTLVAADDHQAALPDWVGVVELLGSVVIAAPSAVAERLRDRLDGQLPVGDSRIRVARPICSDRSIVSSGLRCCSTDGRSRSPPDTR